MFCRPPDDLAGSFRKLSGLSTILSMTQLGLITSYSILRLPVMTEAIPYMMSSLDSDVTNFDLVPFHASWSPRLAIVGLPLSATGGPYSAARLQSRE